MRKQVGWYNPLSRGLCMKYDKTSGSGYETYIVPVFADDEEPVLECEKSRDENNELMNAIRAQTLENQVAMILAMLQSCGNGIEKIDTIRNLVCMRTESVELLERLKKNEQARGD